MTIAQATDRMVETLLIEDNEADIRLTREVLADGRILNRLSVVRDGVSEIHTLARRLLRVARRPLPKADRAPRRGRRTTRRSS